jgi:hypothetical protein
MIEKLLFVRWTDPPLWKLAHLSPQCTQIDVFATPVILHFTLYTLNF